MNKEMTKNIDINKFETIFDHNITQKELEYLIHTRSKEEYLKGINYNQDKCYYDLYWLYAERKDNVIADKYYNKSKKAQKEYKKLKELAGL